MPNTETLTRAEARLLLASLKKDCPCQEPEVKAWNDQQTDVCGLCHNTGKVPVLDLREPCNQIHNIIVASVSTHSGANSYFYPGEIRSASCKEAGCQGWLPKWGRDALHLAMEKDGWNYEIIQLAKPGYWNNLETRRVTFWRQGGTANGQDADDDLAAVKAMQAEGRI